MRTWHGRERLNACSERVGCTRTHSRRGSRTSRSSLVRISERGDQDGLGEGDDHGGREVHRPKSVRAARARSAVTGSLDEARLAARTAADKQAENVVVLDVGEQIAITDYFVICSAPSE